jgi:peptide/nickel transport system substrate-binding protein
MIERVTIVNDQVVEIVTKQASRALLPTLTIISMLPPQLGARLGDKFATQPTGTDPYRLVSYAANSQMAIEATDDYWGAKPQTQRIVFRILPESATRLAARESGEVALIAACRPASRRGAV